MEFNAVQYRSSSNAPFTQPSSRYAGQMMYQYGNYGLQSYQTQAPQHQQHHQYQHQAPHSQQMPQSRPSSSYPTWNFQLEQNQYSQIPQSQMPLLRETTSQDSSDQTNGSTPQPTSVTTNSFSSSLTGHGLPVTTDYFVGTVIDTSSWGQKVCEELDSFPSLDPDVSDFSRGLMGHDEDTSIIHLGQYNNTGQEGDGPGVFNPTLTRRLSESSFSMSSTGGALQEASTYEELGSSVSEAVSYASDCEAWNNLEPAPNLLSPLASPRRTQHDSVVRSGSRSRASPAPHNNMRSSPYTMESSRFKRWSTGHAPTSTPSSSRALPQVQDRYSLYGNRLNPHHSMPVYPPSALSNFQLQTQNVLYSQPHPLQSSNPTLFASPDQPFHLEVPRALPSQGLFRLLQSNADRHGGCASHFADLSDPPDLYSSLHDAPSDPPESDMNPSDPDLVPHEQDLRFVGDLYTPRWVRGHGNKREGWCGLCKPGRWLVLKNSAFWYDKSFTHGVSAATGAAFQGPQETRRTEGNLDVWEGLCGSCGEWIALVSSKKKGTTWFRHAYKCHTHPKVKDGPKRRRETHHTVRARAASSASATSSSYPICKEESQHSKVNQQANSTASTDRHSLPAVESVSSSSSQGSTTTSSSSMQPPSLQHTLQHNSQNINTSIGPKQEPVVGLFSHPLHPISSFGGQIQSRDLSHQVSEPELVGVKTTISPLTSLASMI
ncbi:hypothetical protein GQ43DRAFT_473566 [Delitschia confertaspora ATCC 74209]|uniref:Transcription regulator Rua1 C-terminal domain-containing protein n=1 Tax=Delitschia confertaspora ATCC 74209 TaxID=1513339 RepID=A0A9P4JHY4_9PLEO|nr:hypothetical protein GQ43DRAFT_473566 [Delitschia confertaspora ATCC 74209]